VFGFIISSFPERGHCFIAPNGIAHQNHFGPHRELIEFSQIPPAGTRVEFDSEVRERGFYAANIRPVSFEVSP
jgi:hypothetical protein